jgi:hypothetical protein
VAPTPYSADSVELLALAEAIFSDDEAASARWGTRKEQAARLAQLVLHMAEHSHEAGMALAAVERAAGGHRYRGLARTLRLADRETAMDLHRLARDIEDGARHAGRRAAMQPWRMGR